MQDELLHDEEDVFKDYLFVADSNGLTSLNDDFNPTEFYAVEMYCNANDQRRCLYGIVNLKESVAEGLKQFIADGMAPEALNLIKQTKYALPESKKNLYSRWLSIIPNPILDPHGSWNHENTDN